MSRPKGPDKDIVSFRVLRTTKAWMKQKAERAGYKTVATYLAARMEEQAAEERQAVRRVLASYSAGDLDAEGKGLPAAWSCAQIAQTVVPVR